jgi:hypothetical protein
VLKRSRAIRPHSRFGATAFSVHDDAATGFATSIFVVVSDGHKPVLDEAYHTAAAWEEDLGCVSLSSQAEHSVVAVTLDSVDLDTYTSR